MSNIKRMKDNDGNYIYPVTHASAVFSDEGQSIDEVIRDLKLNPPSNLNSINPDDFIGTDCEQLQQAFDEALLDNRPIKITRKYVLNENETVFLNKEQIPRKPIYIDGGGTIYKPNDGFIFDSNTTAAGEYVFNNIFFEGLVGGHTKVFNCDKSRLIRIFSEGCYYRHFESVFYSRTILQTIRMRNDTVVYCKHCFDTVGAFDIKVEGVLAEVNKGAFFNQNIIEENLGYDLNRLNNVIITSSCFEGYTGEDYPVFNIKDCNSLVIDSSYFENNSGGDILLDGILNNVSISNNIVLGTFEHDCFIKWKGTLNGCSSFNNRSTITVIHNDSEVVSGFVSSKNDISYKSDTVESGHVYDENRRAEVGMGVGKLFTNIVQNTMNPAQAKEWRSWVGTITNEDEDGIPYKKYVADTTNKNSFIYQMITDTFDRTKKGCVIVVDARTYGQDTFTIAIGGYVTGSIYGRNLFKSKSEEWTRYACYMPLDVLTETDNRVQCQIYPYLVNNSAGYTLDIKNISIYLVDDYVNSDSAITQVGHSMPGVTFQSGLQKFDMNNDGVVDTPNGDTEHRPILNINQVGFVYFDKTLNKPIWWTGEKWVDSSGVDIE